MTKNELKKKLKYVWALQAQLVSDRGQLQTLRDIATKDTPGYSPVSGGSGIGQRVENAVIGIVDLEAVIQEHMSTLVQALIEARKLIALADDEVLRLVLSRHYLNNQKWEHVAADLRYSLQYVHRLHARALDTILEKVNETENDIEVRQK